MQVRELHPSFVAEITGIDFAAPLTSRDIAGIQAAIDKCGVIVLPKANFDDAQLVAFARSFGPTHRSVSMMTRDPKAARVDTDLTDTSNLSKDNKPFAADDRRRANNLGARRWHTDGSYLNPTGKYSMLSARQVAEQGGETEFADMRGAYDALPGPMKVIIEDLEAEHSFEHSRAQSGFGLTEEEKRVTPPVRHRIVRRDPVTGRKSLYIGTPASHVVGWPVSEGIDLLHELLDFATRREFVHAHKWSVGDLVMWDNRVTLHRARRHFPESAPRDMRRATVAELDDAPALLD